MNDVNDLGTEISEQLTRVGSDLSKAHSFDFYLYLPFEGAAIQVAGRLEERGFATEVEREGTGTEWICRATKIMIPDESVLREYGTWFGSLVDAFGGEFDRWESHVVKGSV